MRMTIAMASSRRPPLQPKLRQEGSVSVVAVAVLVSALGISQAILGVVSVVSASLQADGAADLAAHAAATSMLNLTSQPCDAARAAAQQNGARMLECTESWPQEGPQFLVRVEVAPAGLPGQLGIGPMAGEAMAGLRR